MRGNFGVANLAIAWSRAADFVHSDSAVRVGSIIVVSCADLNAVVKGVDECL